MLPFEVEGHGGQEDSSDDLPVEDEHEVIHTLIKHDLREQEHPSIYGLDQHDHEISLLSRVHDYRRGLSGDERSGSMFVGVYVSQTESRQRGRERERAVRVCGVVLLRFSSAGSTVLDI